MNYYNPDIGINDHDMELWAWRDVVGSIDNYSDDCDVFSYVKVNKYPNSIASYTRL